MSGGAFSKLRLKSSASARSFLRKGDVAKLEILLFKGVFTQADLSVLLSHSRAFCLFFETFVVLTPCKNGGNRQKITNFFIISPNF